MYDDKRDSQGRKVRDEYGGGGYYVEDFRGDKIKTDQFGTQIHPSHWDNNSAQEDYVPGYTYKASNEKYEPGMLKGFIILAIVVSIISSTGRSSILGMISYMLEFMYETYFVYLWLVLIPIIQLLTSRESRMVVKVEGNGHKTRIITVNGNRKYLANATVFTLAGTVMILPLGLPIGEVGTILFGYLLGTYVLTTLICKRIVWPSDHLALVFKKENLRGHVGGGQQKGGNSSSGEGY